MFRFTTPTEHLDIDTYSAGAAWHMARAVRPHALIPDVDKAILLPREDLYTEDMVAHWSHPHETGEIVEIEVPRMGRVYHVQWPNGLVVPYLHTTSLIRVTKLTAE